MQYTNKREKTRDSIFAAYGSLLKSRRANSITVKDVCTEAGINRSTFYTYFNDIPQLEDDLIESILTEVGDKAKAVITSLDDIDAEVITPLILGMLREYNNIPVYLIRSAPDRFAGRLLDIMTNVLSAGGLIGQEAPIDQIKLYLKYHLAGVVALESTWEDNPSDEELAGLIPIIIGLATRGPITMMRESLKK